MTNSRCTHYTNHLLQNCCTTCLVLEVEVETKSIVNPDKMPSFPWRVVTQTSYPDRVNIVSDEPSGPSNFTFVATGLPKDGWFAKWLMSMSDKAIATYPPASDVKPIGSLFRIARIAIGLPISEAAERLCVDEQTMEEIETGKKEPASWPLVFECLRAPKFAAEWVPCEEACLSVSPDKEHECSRRRNHPGIQHHATDPAFGNVMSVWVDKQAKQINNQCNHCGLLKSGPHAGCLCGWKSNV